MSKKLIEMKIVIKLILLLQRGLSERRIARELRISRPSVSRFRERLVASGKTLEELLALEDTILSAIVQPRTEKTIAEDERSDFVALRRDYYVAELRRTGVTRMLLWKEYLKDTLRVMRTLNFVNCWQNSHYRDRPAITCPCTNLVL